MILSQYFSSSLLGSSTASTSTTSNSSTASSAVLDKVSKLMAARNTEAPKLNAELSKDNTKLSGLGKLLSSLSSFQSVAKSLSGQGLYASASATPANILSATTSSSAKAGTYALEVKQLAQSQTLTSKAVSSASASIGTGATATLKFEFGSTSGSTSATTFSASGTAKTVVIQAKDNSLQGIAAAINNADIGVKATVTSSASGYALTLTSPSGSANSMRIGVSGDPALQKVLAYNPAGTKNLTQTQAAQNAEFSIDGVKQSTSSNVVSDALTGSTLSLTATGMARVTVARDDSQLAKNITLLVDTYNTLNTNLNALQQGELKSGSSVAQVQSQLAQVLASATSGALGSTALSLEKIGITREKNGNLTLNASQLQNVINENPQAVAQLFTNDGKGVADKLAAQIQGMVVSTGSVSKEKAAVSKDISVLNDKKSKLEKKLTLQANALVAMYSKQSGQTSSTTSSSAATNFYSRRNSLFDYLS
jgi:flagellar hook-associated protein 2